MCALRALVLEVSCARKIDQFQRQFCLLQSHVAFVCLVMQVRSMFPVVGSCHL
jgi:hypothetical protein